MYEKKLELNERYSLINSKFLHILLYKYNNSPFLQCFLSNNILYCKILFIFHIPYFTQMEGISFSKSRLNFHLAQSNRKPILKRNLDFSPNRKQNNFDITSSQKQKQLSKNNSLNCNKNCYSKPKIMWDHLELPNKRYLNDSLDVLTSRQTIEDNKSFNDLMSNYPSKSYHKSYPQEQAFNQNYSLSESRFLPKSTQLQFYAHQQTNTIKNDKPVDRREKPFRPKNRYFQNLDNTMKEISNNLSALTFQLTKNTRNLERLQKINEQQQNKARPSRRQQLRRANFKYAEVNTERDRYTSRLRPHIVYQDKVYKDPKYLIWNPMH